MDNGSRYHPGVDVLVHVGQARNAHQPLEGPQGNLFGLHLCPWLQRREGNHLRKVDTQQRHPPGRLHLGTPELPRNWPWLLLRVQCFKRSSWWWESQVQLYTSDHIDQHLCAVS